MGKQVSDRTLLKKFPEKLLDGRDWMAQGKFIDAHVIPIRDEQLWHYAIIVSTDPEIVFSRHPICLSELARALCDGGVRADKSRWYALDLYPPLGRCEPNPFHGAKNTHVVNHLRKSEQRGKIYFIHSADTMFVKIGWAKNVRSRRGELQIGCPLKLKTILMIPDQLQSDEAALHNRFRAYHERGEWYRYEGEIEAFALETWEAQRECRKSKSTE